MYEVESWIARTAYFVLGVGSEAAMIVRTLWTNWHVLRGVSRRVLVGNIEYPHPIYPSAALAALHSARQSFLSNLQCTVSTLPYTWLSR